MSRPRGATASTPSPAATADAPAATPSWAEQLVRLLDDGLRVPGTELRFGADAVLGMLLPGVGDLLTGSGSFLLLWLALQRGVPTVVLLRMVLNVLVDGVVGVVPVVGDAFDLFFKSNRRNLSLLQRATYSPRKARAQDYLIVGATGLVFATLVCLPMILLWWLVGSR